MSAKGAQDSNRTSSAGYRFPLQSRPHSSQYRETAPPPSKPAPKAAPVASSKHTDADFTAYDAVTQDKIWSQGVDNEKRCVKSWEENWGFLTEFDPKGRPITPKAPPEKVNMFSDNIPNTNAGNYGSQLSTETGRNMQQLEFQFHSQNRKKKLGNDLVCY